MSDEENTTEENIDLPAEGAAEEVPESPVETTTPTPTPEDTATPSTPTPTPEDTATTNADKKGGDKKSKKTTDNRGDKKPKKDAKKDLFVDLRDRPKHEVEDELKVLKRRQSVARAEFESVQNERKRQINIVQAIRGAIAETKGIKTEHKGIIGTIGGREKSIRDLRATRDSINSRVVLPLKNIEDEIVRTYEILTAEMKNMRYPGVKQEEALFSFFFELQEMYKLATESNAAHLQMIEEINIQRNAIATLRVKESEHDEVMEKVTSEKPGMKGIKATPWEEKTYNKQIMKLLEEMRKKRVEMRNINREVGRLDAFLRVERKKSQQSGSHGKGNDKRSYNRGPNMKEVRRKAASGESMSLADLGALMSSGGLSTVKPEHNTEKRNSKKKAMSMKKIGASRGSRNRRKPTGEVKRRG